MTDKLLHHNYQCLCVGLKGRRLALRLYQCHCLTPWGGGGGDSAYERGWDARRLA